MTRVATILFALFALAVSASFNVAAAASAEDAIKAWIASVPSTDWKITYANVAYDPAGDRTTVSGFTATSTSLNLTAVLGTIQITGYTATSDGGFNASSLSADSGSITADKAHLDIARISATNFGTGAMTPIAYDKDRPFTSVVQLYANLLKVHVDHAGIAAATFKDETHDTDFSYSDFAVDNWAVNGKIGRMSMGPMDASFTDKDGGPVRFQVGGFESRDTDLEAIVRVYDPSQYANGVGDLVWRPALGLARYFDFTIQSPDFDLTMGEWRLENVKIRQPQRSFAQFFDAAARSDAKDLDAQGMRAMFDLWSAFSLGKFSVSDATLDTNDGSGSLGAFTVSDFSADGLGEVSLDKFETNFDGGFARLGRIAAGNIVFPGIDKLIAAYEASQRDQDVDFAALAAKLGYIEAADIDFETADTPETSLDKLRLDLAKYVGMVPTDIALSITGFDAPAELFSADDVDMFLKDLGYNRLRADYGVKLAWHEGDQTVSVDDFHLNIADLGNFTGTAVFGKLSREALGNVTALPATLGQLDLVSSRIAIEDRSLFNRWIAQQAYEQGIPQADYRKQLADMVPDLVSDIGDAAFQKKLAGALTTFILRPGSLTIASNPPDPLPATGLVLFASLFPTGIPQILGLDVSAIPGPEPVPYDYAPRHSSPTPTVTPDINDYRHVPEKKR